MLDQQLPSTKEPKVGLALGSGGARGLAHIGILKVFEEHDIPVHIIAGSSMGSLVGGLYALGHSPVQMKKLTAYFPQKLWVDYTVPKMGLVAGEKLKEIIRLLTKNKKIEEAGIPLAIVATHLEKGKRKVFRKGPMAEAIRASVSIPGIFVPANIDGELFVDGGVIDRVPVSVVKDMGADIVIAVDVSYFESTSPIRSIFDVIAQTIDIMEREILEQRMIEADLILRPKVGHYSTTMFTKVDEIIEEGEKAALAIIPRLKTLLAQGKETNERV